MKKLLHVGCGHETMQSIKGFDPNKWQEVRFDIDASVKPDILGTLTDMSQVQTASVDAIFSSHNIEHLFAHEVPLALKEFHRVLKPDGFVVLTCPDLQSVCAEVAAGRLETPLYNAPVGAITAIDVLYGHRNYIHDGKIYMAHKTGFTYDSLQQKFIDAGFESLYGVQRFAPCYDLWFIVFKCQVAHDFLMHSARTHFPQMPQE